MTTPSGTVTLLTDFGTRDAYVASVKGVILSRFPMAQVVDITHEIPPQDVLAGALVLAEAAPWFPPGTVHVAVVDPGVGTSRRAIVCEGGGHWVVAPDNGLVSLWLDRVGAWRCHALVRSDLALPRMSHTFHGRDLFGPAGASLAAGDVDIDECGPAVEPVRLDVPAPKVGDRMVTGEVVSVDHFGNLVTNVRDTDLPAARGGLRVELGAALVGKMVRTYGEAEPGALVALVGSGGLLEVAVVQGSAHERLGAGRGAPVVIRW
jgi:S-adenosylmethionine hydrolase